MTFTQQSPESEPSYIEEIQGAGFYTQADNPTGEEEGLRFLLPVDANSQRVVFDSESPDCVFEAPPLKQPWV